MSTKGSFSRLHRSRPKDTGTTFPSQKIRESSEAKNVSKQKPAAAASVFQVKPAESRDNIEKNRVQGRPGESSRHLEQRSPRSNKTRETLQANGHRPETQATTIKPERSKSSTTYFPEREIVVYAIVSLPPTASEIRRNLQTGREVDDRHQKVNHAQQVAISRNQNNVQAQVEENLRQQKVIGRQQKEISKHVDVIESQAGEILRFKNIIEAQKQEILKQAEIIRNQREEISKYVKAVNEQNEKISSQNKCIRDQEDEITKHLKVIQDQKRTNTELSQQIQDLQPQLQKSKAQVLNFKTVLQTLEDHITNVESNNIKLTRNNEFLTSCISETKVAPAPIHNESHYIDQIERLKHLVSSRVAELCKSEECKSFRVSEQVIGEVLRRLQECGLFGRRTGTFLSKGMIWDLHLDSRRRIAVLRHIIALFLHTYIFDTFAFGLDATSSQVLRDIENTTLLIEPDFSRVLMIRQAIGKAALHSLQASDIRKSTFIENLQQVITKLLPNPRGVNTLVMKIANLAVTLADDMTVEQTLFRCTFVEAGADPDPGMVDVPDHKQTGNVSLCTFPGFWKVANVEDGENWLPLVRPCVELESAFDLGGGMASSSIVD